MILDIFKIISIILRCFNSKRKVREKFRMLDYVLIMRMRGTTEMGTDNYRS
jgi:hypothetical protein